MNYNIDKDIIVAIIQGVAAIISAIISALAVRAKKIVKVFFRERVLSEKVGITDSVSAVVTHADGSQTVSGSPKSDKK